MRNRIVLIYVSLLVFFLSCGSLVLRADQSEGQSLFRIERSKNANIVQYDVQIGADGKLDPKKPVVVYWVRLAEQGQVKKLSWVQRKFAFGFSVDFDRTSDSASLDMALDIGRLIKVHNVNGFYLASADIDGTFSRIERMYIHATGKGILTKVQYIDLHGTALDAGHVTYERFIP